MKKFLLLITGAGVVFAFVPPPQGANQNMVKGWVINLKGDTIKGDIKINPKKDLDQYTKVAMKVGAANTNYAPAKIKEYCADGQIYVSRKLDGENVLLKRLSTGNINLYEHKTEKYVMNNTKVYTDYYYEKKGSTEPVEIKSGKGFKKQMAELMADNAAIVKDLEEKKYDYEKVVDLFEEYNNPAPAEN